MSWHQSAGTGCPLDRGLFKKRTRPIRYVDVMHQARFTGFLVRLGLSEALRLGLGLGLDVELVGTGSVVMLSAFCTASANRFALSLAVSAGFCSASFASRASLRWRALR
jgi:hypothetical protein